MNKIKKTTHGFTLIELLVVISIIGLLSSVVFASLNTAREKSRLSGIKQEMVELRNALELNYNTISGYSNLDSFDLAPPPEGLISGVWMNVENDCDIAYGPASANVLAGETIGTAQILPICKRLVILANKTGDPGRGTLVVKGDVPNNKYSITVSYIYSITCFAASTCKREITKLSISCCSQFNTYNVAIFVKYCVL